MWFMMKSAYPLSLDIPSNDDESFPSNGGNNLAVGKRPKIKTTLISLGKKVVETEGYEIGFGNLFRLGSGILLNM